MKTEFVYLWIAKETVSKIDIQLAFCLRQNDHISFETKVVGTPIAKNASRAL